MTKKSRQRRIWRIFSDIGHLIAAAPVLAGAAAVIPASFAWAELPSGIDGIARALDMSASGWSRYAWTAALFAGFVLAAALAYGILFRLIRIWAGRLAPTLEAAIVRYGRRPLAILILLLAAGFILPLVSFPPELFATVKRLHSILLTAVMAWLLVGGIRAVEAVVLAHYDVTARDNFKARAIHTQINVFKNVATFVILLLALAMVLMSFDQVRQLGVSLLASAGVAGIIIGFAAQRSIATVFAGIQLAITQPIRLGDVVIVENEWGWIEEITLTYVVVRIWDLRRLVVPITHFIEKPFQNWTRISADILGTVFLYVDYTVPVEEVRKELRRLLENSPKWDGKVCVLQVTNASERTVELRALMSASDSPAAWDLRCEIREKLIAFLKENYPESLPRIRAHLEGDELASGPRA